jgi:hypothetical protein
LEGTRRHPLIDDNDATSIAREQSASRDGVKVDPMPARHRTERSLGVAMTPGVKR